jgi:multidrug efflux system outer membrane protein
MNKIVINSTLITLALSACTMAPKYVRPNSPVEKTLGEKQVDGQKNASEKNASEIKWQDFFQSQDLQKIIQTALDNNRDLKVAVLNVDAARALYRVTRSDLLPSVNLNGSASKQKSPKNVSSFNGGQTNTRFDANVGAAFEIDLFGKVQSLNKSALETYFATAEAKNAVQIALISEVANAYLQMLADQKIWQLSKDTVTAQEKSFDLVAKKFEYGIVSKLDVAQARTTIETAKANQALYAKKVEQDKNALALLMGVAHCDLLDKPQNLSDIKLLENLPSGLSSDVLLTRPDIMQAEHQLKSANANIGAARAAFFPSISLTGSYGYASSDLSTLFSGGSAGAWSFVPKVDLPIFEGGKNIANLDYATVSKNITIAKYEKAIQTAFREVADQLAAKKNIDDQMRAQNNLVQAAKDSYNISNARYKEGIDNFINVLSSQTLLFSAEQNQIDLEKDRLTNLVQLYKVLGGGIN